MKKAKAVRKQTGRPALEPGEPTVRVGFSVPQSLWEWFTKTSDKKGLSYSGYFRALAEREQRGGN